MKNQKKTFSSDSEKEVSHSTQNIEDDISLYALNRSQLKNLVDKNIHFGFFQLEDFSFPCDQEAKYLLQKAEKKTEGAILSDLKDQDLQQPLVLICNKGIISRKISQKLRDKGFVNVYFMGGGLKALLEGDGK